MTPPLWQKVKRNSIAPSWRVKESEKADHGIQSHQFSSVTQSCPTLCNSMDCSTPGFPVHHQLPELTQTHLLSQWCHPTISSSVVPFLLPPSILSSIRVFSNESVLRIRWSKYWSFSFNISPSNEYSGLFPLGWAGLISLQYQGLSRIFSNTTVQKHQLFSTQVSL